jgi:DDE superfamily endonuclease
LIFHGKPTEEGGKIEEHEKHLYNKGVTVYFNDSAYNNEQLTMEWLDTELIPEFKPTAQDRLLLALDTATFHKMPAILQKLRDNYIIPALVPPGCTGLLQPLDTAVNKPFKELLREQTELYMDLQEEAGDCPDKWTVSQKRVMVTHVVTEAWDQFCREKKSLIQKSFIDVGLNIASDGSEDSKLSIKGYENGGPEIGDWSQIDNYEDYQELPIGELEEYIKEEEIYITTNYRGLLRSRLIEILEERGLLGSLKSRADIVGILQENDKFLELYCNQWQIENYHCNTSNVGRYYEWQL